LIQQRLGVFYIGSIETFTEPTVSDSTAGASARFLPCPCHTQARFVAARHSNDFAVSSRGHINRLPTQASASVARVPLSCSLREGVGTCLDALKIG